MPMQGSTALTLTLAVTGASGALLARTMIGLLENEPRIGKLNLIYSDSALRVLAEELGIAGRSQLVERLLGTPSAKIQVHADGDIGANIASGSYPTSAMIILPCSMGTLGAISSGLASTLIQRASDVCLKERRPLILCLRETPLNRIHLRNMQIAADAGATLYPCVPTFYDRPESTADMARNFACRVLAHIGLTQPDAYQWQPDAPQA